MEIHLLSGSARPCIRRSLATAPMVQSSLIQTRRHVFGVVVTSFLAEDFRNDPLHSCLVRSRAIRAISVKIVLIHVVDDTIRSMRSHTLCRSYKPILDATSGVEHGDKLHRIPRIANHMPTMTDRNDDMAEVAFDRNHKLSKT